MSLQALVAARDLPSDLCACEHSRWHHTHAGQSCNQIGCQCAGFRWPDLSNLPDEVIQSEWARRCQARRKVKAGGRNGGRPCVPTACPKCGRACPSRTEAKAHCRAPAKGESLGSDTCSRRPGMDRADLGPGRALESVARSPRVPRG